MMKYDIPYAYGLFIDIDPINNSFEFKLADLESNPHNKDSVNLFNKLKNGEEITLLQNGENIKRTKLSWMLMAKHQLYLPVGYESYISNYQFRSTKMHNVSSLDNNGFQKADKKRDYVILFKIPVYLKQNSSDKTEYRIIPEFPDYAISESGKIIEVLTRKEAPVFHREHKKELDSYPAVRIYSRVKKANITRAVHKLMGVTWVDNDDWENNIVLNHKDGDKANYKSSNLEWITSTDNARHAFANGLRTDNFPIRVYDLATKEKFMFASVNDAFTHIKKSIPNNFLKTLERNGDVYILSDRYEFKSMKTKDNFLLETKSVSEANKIIKERIGDQIYQAYNILTHETIVGNASFIENKLNRRDGYCHSMEANKQISNKWIFRKIENALKPPDVSEFKLAANVPRHIKLTNVSTGEEKIFPSLRNLEEEIGLSRKTIQKNIKNNKILAGFKIEYVTIE